MKQDIKDECRELVEVCEDDPIAALLILFGFTSRGIGAVEIAEHVTAEEMQTVVRATRPFLNPA